MSRRVSSLIEALTRAYRGGYRLTRGARPAWSDDAAATFRDVCRNAYDRRGAVGLCFAAAAEWLNLARSIVDRRRPHADAAPAADSGLPPSRRDSPFRRLLPVVRHAARGLVAARSTAAIAGVILALGIGVTTAVFSVLDAVLWRPVPYADADRLVEMATFNAARKFVFMGFYSPALLTAWRTQTDLFDRVEAYDSPSVVYAARDGSELLPAAVVTPGLFSFLGVAPERGRVFAAPEGQDGMTAVVLVSDAFWRSRLGQDPEVLSQSVVIDDVRRRIVGVMPASFRFPTGETTMWMPYDAAHPPVADAARTLTPIARLAQGVSMAQAEAEAERRGSQLAAAAGSPGVTAQLYPLSTSFDMKTQQSLWVLGGAVGFLFLVVCANVANLALSRSIQRTRVYAIRTALGASRADLVAAALSEHAAIAMVGCAGGLAVAVGLLTLTTSVLPQSMTVSALTPIALDWRATTFAMVLGTLAVLVGLPAAVIGSRPSVHALLGSGSRGASHSPLAARLRSSLVVVEVSVSTALLVGAALMTRSLLHLEGADRGFETANLISIRVGLPAVGYWDAASADQFIEAATARLRRAPGVTMATEGDLPTNARPYMLGPVEFSSQPGATGPQLIVPMLAVPPDYFSAMGIRLVAGRTFGPSDSETTVIVSESFAKTHWRDGQAVGGRFRRPSQPWQTIIGVVGDIRSMSPESWQRGYNVYYQQGKAPEAMRPLMSASSIAEYRTLVVRSDEPARTVGALPLVIHAIDSHVVVARIALVEHLYADAIARPRTVFLLMAVFAGVGLALAMAGMYGVLSYLVTLRLRDIGIRLALGAKPRDVGRLVLRNGVGLAAVGLLTGLGLAMALVRVVRALLYDVNPSDPWSFAGVSVLLALTSVAAAWRPARRAMRVDPVTLLREE